MDNNLRMLRHLRNTVTKMVRNAKDSYVKNSLSENQDNYKRFRQDLNSLLDPTKGKKNDISLIDEHDNLINLDNIPNKLNDH